MADSKSQSIVSKTQTLKNGGKPTRKQKSHLTRAEKQKTLAAACDSLPANDIQNEDIMSLLLKFIVETPKFQDTIPSTVAFNSHILGALKLMHEIKATEGVLDNEQELLDILAGNETGSNARD